MGIREKSLKSNFGFDTRFFVQGVSRAVSPAGVTIGMVTDVRALWPVLSCIKVDGKRFFLYKFTFFYGGGYFLFRIRNFAFELAVLLV